MRTFHNITKTTFVAASLVLGMMACNKAPLDPVPNDQPVQGTSPTLASLLDNPDSSFTILKAAVVKAGLLGQLSSPTLRFTVFAPDNAAFIASGIPSTAVIAALPAAQVSAIVQYHVIPQVITTSSIPDANVMFPNLEYPTIFNPAPTVSSLLRLSTFPSKRGGAAWVNNIPVVATNISAVNGVLHKVARVIAPPSTYLWDKISTDPELTYLKAAIERADSGVAVGGRLQDALLNIGANLTVLAPTDAAFQTTITGALYQGLLSLGYPANVALPTAQALASSPTVFTNPLVMPVLSAQTVKGIVVYHILSTKIPGVRAFSVNLPTSVTLVKTLLNSVVTAHPGVTVQATFTGPVVSSATFKGLANATAANAVSPDNHYLNGVLHKIDGVLLPQ